MTDESYIDRYTATDEETGEKNKGMIVKGKDVIVLYAPAVMLSPETPLLTEAQDVAGAINELFGLGAEGGDFRAIGDNGADSIWVNLDRSDNSGGANCGYTYFDYSESIKTTTTIGDTTTENTATFTKRIITELINVDTETLLLKTSYDEGTGEIFGYTDRNDEAVYVGGTAVSDAMSGNADIAAIAWVLAKNMEQAESFNKQKKAYREGLSKGEGVVEEWEDTESTEIEFDVDKDGNGNDPAFIDFDKGVQLMYTNPNDPTDTVTVRFWLDHSNDGDYFANGTYRFTRKGTPTLTMTKSDGTVINSTMGMDHVRTNKYGYDETSYPRYITNYRIRTNGKSVWVHAHVVHPNGSFWSSDGNYFAIPTVTIPDGYEYAGAKNYDSTET